MEADSSIAEVAFPGYSIPAQGGTSQLEGYLMDRVTLGFHGHAYSVVPRSCATGNYSFGHELGHNMGARHDWDDDSTDKSPCHFNHSFRFPAGGCPAPGRGTSDSGWKAAPAVRRDSLWGDRSGGLRIAAPTPPTRVSSDSTPIGGARSSSRPCYFKPGRRGRRGPPRSTGRPRRA
jgi:hypothetical protein